MIIILQPDVAPDGPEVKDILAIAAGYSGVTGKVYTFKGQTHTLVEVHLIGETKLVPQEAFADRRGVVRVVRVSERYRLIGRHAGQVEVLGFDYRGEHFGQDTFHVM